MKPELTQVRLKELLSYDPETGLFVWRNPTGLKMKAGDPAGYVNKQQQHHLIGIDGKLYKAHRLAWLYMKGVWPDPEADHRDGDSLNNRFLNLREATHAQNMMNKKKHANNRSGYKGVSWHKQSGKWSADITCEGKTRFLGLFDTPQEASGAYQDAAQKLFGEFKRQEVA